MVYFFLYLPLIGLAYLNVAGGLRAFDAYKGTALPILYVLLVLVSGLRWRTGNDWNPYLFFSVSMQT